jgi:putative two-component system response regulator
MGEKKSILAVDDMPMNLRSLKAILEPYYNIHLAKSCAIAFSVLDKTDIDLLLLDIEMPDMSGIEFLEALKKMPAKKDIPVIFVSSHNPEEMTDTVTRLGAKDYVMKPYELNVLLQKINTALDL